MAHPFEPDTLMGGTQRSFPTTQWPSLSAAPDRASVRFREKMQEILSRYWKPIYRTIRISWRKGNEDAKDLTQSFIARVLEDDFLQRFDPRKGRFRAFVRAALQHFMMDAEKARRRIKRGGEVALLSLDLPADGPSLEPADPRGAPEAALDREWADALLEDGIEALRTQLSAEGRATWFKVYELLDLGDEALTYRAAAARLGLSESDVTHYLHGARRRLRSILVERIREYALTEEEIYDELHEIFSG